MQKKLEKNSKKFSQDREKTSNFFKFEFNFERKTRSSNVRWKLLFLKKEILGAQNLNCYQES